MLAPAAFAQVSGTVLDRAGAPIANVAIQAKSAGGQMYSASSDANGKYTLKGLPAGDYQLTAAAPGLTPYGRSVHLDQAQSLDLHLDDLQLNTLGEDRQYYTDLMGKHDVPKGPTPRTRDGNPDLSGVWLPSFPTDGGNPEPLPSAAAILKQRGESGGKDIPSSHCLPLGVVMSTFLFPYEFVQKPKLLVMMYEGEFPRQIFLDGREHPKDLNPSWLGHSVGHWEKDTLVIDTVGFNGKAWLSFAGHPASEKLHIVERYRRPDLGHLEYEITIDDAGAYAKPWTIKKSADLSRDDSLMEYICNENERDLTHLGK
ncbi:MAG TPA: carboxypeptidase-like regulatory domain-containing protein [Bryobacteraceae bacterium]|nr:carboxypeptidase-like regulatory domain-containing protein [Bryobacteraceae bacterium]